MIISKTPFRISFFGGGTDFPEWFIKNGGQVLSTTINKYCYISCRYLPNFFNHNYRIVYTNIETVNNISEIQHPAVKAVLQQFDLPKGLEIHHDGDLPAYSGLGSSSAFTVGLLNAVCNLIGKKISKNKLALESLRIEHHVIQEKVGYQDQIAVTHGGFNNIKFLKNGKFKVVPMTISKKRYNDLQTHLMLFFTGISRISSEVSVDTIKNISSKIKEMQIMNSFVNEGIDILKNKNKSLLEFGILLDEAWKIKRKLSNRISNNKIDSIYKKAKNAGAIGGKILGAGGGGFMMLFVEPKKQEAVRKVLSSLVYVPVVFENKGSQIVIYEPKGL